MRERLFRSAALFAALSLLVPAPTFAQTAPAAAGAELNSFNAEQLDALLAPIALYPDALLTQVMMAATFPLQVVDASRWLEQPANKALTGDALIAALSKQTWDPSVKSLVPFPQVLATLNSKLDWTQQVGYAFATQQGDVMNSIQRLRLQAQIAGNLKSTEQQRVVVEKNIIVIDPANPKTVYVPVYIPPSFTAPGHIRATRLCTFRRRRATSWAPPLPRASPSPRAWRLLARCGVGHDRRGTVAMSM